MHASVELTRESRQQRTPIPIEDDPVLEIGQFLDNVQRYSEMCRETSQKTRHPLVIVLKSAFAFVKSHLLEGGILAGWRGLVIAWNETNGVFYKYIKIYADRHR